MIAAQKAQAPLAGGAGAETKKSPSIVGAAEQTGKPDLLRDPAFQSLQARLAQQGFSAHVSANGTGIYIARWGLVRFFDQLHEAEGFAEQVGARS
jgi:hypothetical protein